MYICQSYYCYYYIPCYHIYNYKFFIVKLYIHTILHKMYNYRPQTNRVYKAYSVAAVLYLQSVLHVKLFRPWNMFCTFTSALPTVCVHCPIWLFLYYFNFVLSCFVAQVQSKCLQSSNYYWFTITVIIIIIIIIIIDIIIAAAVDQCRRSC